jgi:hypothetical protein
VDTTEPYPVASSHDVEIISLDQADSGALVVGDMPAGESFVPATAEDIVVNLVLPDRDGMTPRLRLSRGASSMPILVAAVEGNSAR